LRLLFFIHSLSSGGAERVTSLLSDYWAEKGCEVALVTVSSEAQDFYKINKKIKRIALGLDIHSKSFLHALINNVRRVFALRKVLLEHNPDIAIAMMSTANCLLAWSGKGTGITLVGSERTYPPMWPLGKIWEFLRSRSYPHLDAIVAQTHLSAKWLSQHAPAKHIKVIPNPVKYPLTRHLPGIDVRSVFPQGETRRILLAVGRLGLEKGLDRLLPVFAKVSAQYPEWVLVVLGEGNQRIELERQVKELGINSKTYLLGSIGNVCDWYEAADIYILTSRFEGFPNTLLEALAYGLPSIAVDCETGPRDILRHEVDGLLVLQDDKKSLEDALHRLMRDEKLREKYAKRAVEVRQRYSLEKIIQMWEQLFEEVKE